MIIQKSPLLVLSQIINSLFGYIGLFFIIRFIGLQYWGFLSFSLAFIGLLSIIGDLGYGSAHLRFLSDKNSDKGVCNGTFLTIRIVQTFITVFFVLIALFVWIDVLHHGFQSNVEVYTIILLLPYTFFVRLKDVPRIYFNSKLQSARMSIPQMIEAIIRNSAFIYLGILYFYRIPGYNIINASILFAIIYSISYFIYFIIAYAMGRPWNIKKPTMDMFKKYTRIAYPLALASVIGSVSGNIDKVLIEFYWHAVATGAFAALQKIVTPIVTFSGTISVFFIPLLMRGKTQKEFTDNIISFERTISLFILPLVVIFLGLRIYVANLWDSSLIPYSELLIFLSIASYFIAINSPYTSSLIARGLTKKIGFVTIISLIINITLDLLLIPSEIFGITFFSLGVLGGAVSTFIAMLFETIAYRIIVIKGENININYKLLTQLIPSGIQFLFLFFITIYIKVYSIILFIPVAVLSVVIFFAIAILLKEISFKQLKTFITLLNPFSIKKTFKNE